MHTFIWPQNDGKCLNFESFDFLCGMRDWGLKKCGMAGSGPLRTPPPLSSSSIGCPMIDSSWKISVMLFMWSLAFWLSFNFILLNLVFNISLFAQDFFWNWFSSVSHTSTGSSGSPNKYNNEGLTDRTMVVSAFSYLILNFLLASSDSLNLS